ncbi:MAG: NTPase, partial [Cyanobacteria bacterium J06635_1]
AIKVIQNEESHIIRTMVIQGISESLKDNSPVFEALCLQVQQDPFMREYDWEENPRQAALEILVQQYSDHPKTQELLKDRTENDNDKQLRDWARKQMMKDER